MILLPPSAMGPRARRVAPPAGSDDWATLAAASGVILADRLNTPTKLVTPTTYVDATHWLHPSTADHVSFDNTVYPGNSGGSWKFETRPTDTPNSGLVGVYFGNLTSFTQGDTFWASVRVRGDIQQAYQPWLFTAGSGGGSHKFCILSNNTGTNQVNEIVTQIAYRSNLISGYWQDGVSTAVHPDSGLATACSGSDIKWQTGIDRGANPLAGNDPDTGSAWSTCAQDRARYGGLYSSLSLAQPRDGYGDPLSGGFRQYPDEWITLIQRVTVGTWSTNSSRWTLWAAREGQAPVLIHDVTSIKLGNGPVYNTFWLLSYCSNRLSGGTSVSARTNNITGTTFYVTGNDLPTGDGTLEYNASTQRFRWAKPGGAFGTARGFSQANGILTITCNDGGGADNYITFRVDPASLPSSGTVTDTVTITNSRPYGYTWYADVIVSTQIINAPGGFAPVG